MTGTSWLELMDSAGGGFEPVPDGEYDIIVKETEAKKTGNGKDMIAAKLQITVGPHANRLIWNNFTISPESPNAMSYFFQHMGIFGMDRNFFAQNPSIEQVAQTMLNRPARIQVGTRQYQGQNRNEVKKIMPSFGQPAAAPVGMPAAATLAAPVAAAPAPVAPVAVPAPAPVPVAAAPVAAPAPVPAPAPIAAAPAPVAPVAPAPVAPAPVVEAAPIAPAPAPPVVAAPAPVAAPVAPVAEPVVTAPAAVVAAPVAPAPVAAPKPPF